MDAKVGGSNPLAHPASFEAKSLIPSAGNPNPLAIDKLFLVCGKTKNVD